VTKTVSQSIPIANTKNIGSEDMAKNIGDSGLIALLKTGEFWVSNKVVRLLDLPTKLGRNIKHLRDQAGFTQTQLAEMADISQGHLSEIEQGKYWPQPETLVAFAQAFGVQVEDLFRDTTPTYRAPKITLEQAFARFAQGVKDGEVKISPKKKVAKKLV
jgi:transcriptional regulator with XRE-family HTH domain